MLQKLTGGFRPRVLLGVIAHRAAVDPSDKSWREYAATIPGLANAGAKIVVWPEKIAPLDPPGVERVRKLLGDAAHEAGVYLLAGVIVIDVIFQGRRHDLPELAEALAAEVGQRTALLSAREREILENHLLNEVAGTLQEEFSWAISRSKPAFCWPQMRICFQRAMAMVSTMQASASERGLSWAVRLMRKSSKRLCDSPTRTTV